ncbi:hypothetical protein [Veillonella sp. R32]|uniref:hypothetical protein n=1 Tax=Veillonella sp. R32 TaxID=2021312 RepID=UPI0013897F5E|nr:hypothetical protein [Veillonella sp. R32]
MVSLKTMNKKNKIVIILMLLSILACLLYLPWKAEKHGAYGNVLTRPLGYALIGYKPPIYTESDFDTPNLTSFSNIKERHGAFSKVAARHGISPDTANDNIKLKQELQNKGIEIHPSWVKNFERINYTQVMINIGISIIFWSIVLLLVNLV